MLRMKAQCERCHTPLAADGEAMICSFECTFCAACGDIMGHVCPNCSGELLRRPRRTRSPASAAVRTVFGRLQR